MHLKMLVWNQLGRKPVRALQGLGRGLHTQNVSIRNSLVGGAADLPLHVSNIGQPQPQPLTWYSCGPTVYDSAHLGHARTYICTDVIRRILTSHFKVDLHYALGVTDIDDKIIQRATEDGLCTTTTRGVSAVARRYEKAFMRDMDALGVLRPDAILRVTEHMDEIAAYIETLVRNNKAYETDDGVYFDTDVAGESYGKFGVKAGDQLQQQQVVVEGGGGGEEVPPPSSSSNASQKRHWRDFALWKKAKAGEPSWESPWGAGRPGWHIECSAMTHATFGTHLDIHSGGIDLKFPHHTNEVAQCEAHNGCEGWVKFWLHTGHLYIKGSKMSKSLKNFISIKEYLGGEYSAHPATDLRLFFIAHKYHSSLHFSPERIHEAGALREKITSFFANVDATAARIDDDDDDNDGDGKKDGHHCRPCVRSRALGSALSQARGDVHLALANDFDTPEALRVLVRLMSEASKYLAEVHTGGEDGRGLAVEPLYAVAAFVADFMALCGVCLDTGKMGLGGRGTHTEAEVVPFVDGFVDFRAKVRESSLGAIKAFNALKRGGATEAELQAALDELMLSCDWARDAVGRDVMGVRIVDSGGKSTWSKK